MRSESGSALAVLLTLVYLVVLVRAISLYHAVDSCTGKEFGIELVLYWGIIGIGGFLFGLACYAIGKDE